MPRPESIKIPISPEEALRRKYGDINLIEKDVGRWDAVFRVEEGSGLEMSPAKVGRFVRIGRDWAKLKPNLDARLRRQEERKKELKEIVVEHPGLRGLIDVVRRRVVRVDTDTDLKYSPEGLKNACGALYPTVARETPVFRFEGIPMERARMILLAGFAAVNMTQTDYETVVTEDVELDVDGNRLYSLIEAGRVDPTGIGEATMSFSVQSDEYKGSGIGPQIAQVRAQPAQLQPVTGA